MKALATLACALACTFPATAAAQEALVGTWNASYTFTGIQSTVVTVTMNIENVDDGRVKGTAIRRDRGCAGEYPIEGSLKGDALRVRATKKGGPAGDCSFGFAGTVQGDKIVGKYGNYELEFRK